MSPAERAAAIRKAASALDIWAKVAWWRQNIDHTETEAVSIEWKRGAGVDGYTEVADEVERLVSEMWGVLVQKATARIEERVNEQLAAADLPPLGAA